MMDKNAYVWNLDDPMPRATYKGHGDLIRAVGYLEETRCFVTGSWDKCVKQRGGRRARDFRVWEVEADGSHMWEV